MICAMQYYGIKELWGVSNQLVYVKCYYREYVYDVLVPEYFITPKALVAMCVDLKCLFVSCPKKYGCKQFQAL